MNKKMVAQYTRPAIQYIRNTLGENLTGVELGVYKGLNASMILIFLEPKMLYLIDPWNNFMDSGSNEIIGETQYIETCEYLKEFTNKTIIRDTSINAVKQFQDESLDFIYIDGCHLYDSVLEDMSLWYPKIKKNGILCGHDWLIEGVKRAVFQFHRANNVNVKQIGEDWLIQK